MALMINITRLICTRSPRACSEQEIKRNSFSLDVSCGFNMPANIRRIYSTSVSRNFQYRGVLTFSSNRVFLRTPEYISGRKSILREAVKTLQDWASLYDNLPIFNGKRV